MYALTQRTEELEKDRDRVRLALERTEAAAIGYKERSHQQEQSSGAGPNSGEVSVSNWLTSDRPLSRGPDCVRVCVSAGCWGQTRCPPVSRC